MRKVLLVMIIFAGVIITGCSENNTFYFAQITDTHLTEAGDKTNLGNCIKIINNTRLEISFVAHTGDIFSSITSGNIPEMLKPFKELKPVIYFVPGNRDSETTLFKENVSEINFSKEIHGVRFIFFNSSTELNYRKPSENEGLKWLKSEINSTGKPKIIFFHIPCTVDYYANAFHDSFWSEDSIEFFKKIISGNNVKGIICGHFHRDEFHMIGDVPLFVCPPLNNEIGGTPVFRIYEYNNGELSYFTRYVE